MSTEKELAKLRRENKTLKAFYMNVRSADYMCGQAYTDFHQRVCAELDGMKRRNIFRVLPRRRVY